MMALSCRDPMPMTEQDRRALIIAETRTWLGTPYQHQASCRGAGADCLGLVRGVFRGLHGAEPEAPPAYTPDWAEVVRPDGPQVETLRDGAARHLRPVPLGDYAQGDVLIFRMTRTAVAKHAGIYIGYGQMIHACSGRSVCEVSLGNWWRNRCAYAFSFLTEDGEWHR